MSRDPILGNFAELGKNGGPQVARIFSLAFSEQQNRPVFLAGLCEGSRSAKHGISLLMGKKERENYVVVYIRWWKVQISTKRVLPGWGKKFST